MTTPARTANGSTQILFPENSNVLGILRNVTKGLRKIHTTLCGFGLFDLATEQLISRVNMFFQHYHISTNLSKKLDASLGYLQLQIGTP